MEPPAGRAEPGLFAGLVGDGRPLISLTGVLLALSGVFAIFQSATGHFLPHDVAFLGMTPEQLCAINECRIVHFMFHDRVAFGGSIIAIGTLYLWLAAFPLRAGEAWAWWTLVASGTVGFASFLLYLGYGYLDSWHGAATIGLLPCFMLGLVLSRRRLTGPRSHRTLLRPSVPVDWSTRAGLGLTLLRLSAAALILGGLVIMGVGVTTVFVPQDLAFMGITVEELRAINPRLIPLIAHDRAGFGGGVCSCGVTMFLCLWCGTPSRSLWQAVGVAGLAGFGTAIGVHPAVGYNSALHLAPAVLGAAVFVGGLLLARRPMACAEGVAVAA